MPKKDATATLAELEAEFKALSVRVDMDSARRVELVRLIADRKRQAVARVKVRGMDALEREALKIALSEP